MVWKMERGDVVQLAQNLEHAQTYPKDDDQVECRLGIARPIERKIGLGDQFDIEMAPLGVLARQFPLPHRGGERLKRETAPQRQEIVGLQLDRL